ncbi:MAG: glutamine-hydrolyzing carbamoyl-phosphate synthase small subunit [Clostridia bacterium]|nr:glutamine-hydrolyzing carbamoyl-phosphate synthase small subunit [Clostridia bacterium]
MKNAYLVLADGTVFEGYSFGAEKDAVGETVFTVGGMCGYLETVSDPAYFGQIVVQTFPLIGNYGSIDADLQGEISLSGYVVREVCHTPSNFRCEGSLGELLKAKGVPAVCGVDTRALTVHLRENGCMNGKICHSLPKSFEDIKEYKIVSAVESVTRKEKEIYNAEGEEYAKITAIDCGGRKSFIKALTKLGATVTVMPSGSDLNSIMSTNPDGIFITSGPDDPKNCSVLETVKALMGKLPMLGVGLGHQLMALAAGGDTFKMKVGHRGGSQTVRDLKNGRCYITEQNHGYEVAAHSVKNGKITMVSLNDNGVEAIEYDSLNGVSVQFYPTLEDGSMVFESFISRIRGV